MIQFNLFTTIDECLLFKARPRPFTMRKFDNLCMAFYNGPTDECKRENCKFVHDLDQFLAEKPDDIGPVCPIYSTKGFCARGLTCRFAKNHMDENNKNLKQDWYDEAATVDSVNQMPTGNLFSLEEENGVRNSDLNHSQVFR